MESGKIHELLPEIMRSIGSIAKANQTTEGEKYRYRSVDQVLTKLSAALLKYNCCVTFEVLEHKVERYRRGTLTLHNATLRAKLTFYAPDGSCLASTAAGEGLSIDSDKATQKAMSGAFKYCCFYGLCLPVAPELLLDPDHDNPEPPAAQPPERQERYIPNEPTPASVRTKSAAQAIKAATSITKLREYVGIAKQKEKDGKFTSEDLVYVMELAAIVEQIIEAESATV